MSDVLVLGGGIVALLSALELTERGASVTIVEGDQPPASWAGGGILSPLYAWRHSSLLNQLTFDGVDRYRRLVGMLESDGYAPPGRLLNLNGMWVQGDEKERERALRWASEWGLNCEAQSSDGLSGRMMAKGLEGVFFPGLGNVRNPGLLKALRACLQARGVKNHKARISDIRRQGRNVIFLAEDGRQWRADKTVVGMGAGTGALLEKLGVQLPLFPAKGEMLLYQLSPGDVSSVLLTEAGYLIPRNDGAVLVGSTLRKGDASFYPTVSGRYRLERLAQTLMPELEKARPAYHWAGVRPGSDRDYPFIGAVPGADGVYVATGHYRNGLVAAPATAELLAQVLCGVAPSIDPSGYSLPSSSRSSSSFLRR